MIKNAVLVTGVGGNVGQGVLMNLKKSHPHLHLVGTDINKINSGLYFCNDFYLVPYAIESNYKLKIEEIIKQIHPQLIIPTTDEEVQFFSSAKLNLNESKVLVSPKETADTFYDKWLSFKVMSANKIPFAKSCLPSNYNKEFSSIVVKPRCGRGSRNVFINPENILGFDDSYVVQEELTGPELTISYYNDKKNQLVGFIAFIRELGGGMTVKCQVVKDYDLEIKNLINMINSCFSIVGPFNIQAKLTSKGIIPFEINCRYSGTNSIRSEFGFTDVAWSVEEYILNKKPEFNGVKSGSALRFVCDIIYFNKSLSEIEPGQLGAKIKY